jgi:hypothetical protein
VGRFFATIRFCNSPYSSMEAHPHRMIPRPRDGRTGPTGHMRLGPGTTPYAEGTVHSSLRFQSSAASSGVATRLGARSAHLS